MDDRFQLDPKIIHLPNGKTVVACKGLTVYEGESSTTGKPERATWMFVPPQGGPNMRARLRADNLKSILREFAQRLDMAGYALPDAYGVIAKTNMLNVSVKKKVIQVRINQDGEEARRFSFQYDRHSFASYNDAMHNALDLRDLLTEMREASKALATELRMTKRITKALNLKDLL